jgi:hypothetical protein
LVVSGQAATIAAYSAVEKRKKGDVLLKARAEGSDARARAPIRVLAMRCECGLAGGGGDVRDDAMRSSGKAMHHDADDRQFTRRWPA